MGNKNRKVSQKGKVRHLKHSSHSELIHWNVTNTVTVFFLTKIIRAFVFTIMASLAYGSHQTRKARKWKQNLWVDKNRCEMVQKEIHLLLFIFLLIFLRQRNKLLAAELGETGNLNDTIKGNVTFYFRFLSFSFYSQELLLRTP